MFPPTDFHTATLCGDEIIVIGNLGYGADRQPGSTQVMRLSLDNFSISRIETSGAMPGWISEHRARLDDGKITVWDGEILTDSGFVPNGVSFQLCLASGVWTELV